MPSSETYLASTQHPTGKIDRQQQRRSKIVTDRKVQKKGTSMAGLAEYDPPKYLRSPQQAKTCIYFGANLTAEEVQQHKLQLLRGGIPCKTCGGAIPGYHCSHATQGPFTQPAGKCTSCTFFEGKS